MQYITIANTPRPVNFGTAAIMKFEEITGTTFYEFLFSFSPQEDSTRNKTDTEKTLDMMKCASVTDMVSILEACLYGGALKAKTEPVSRDELIDLLDADEDNRLLILSEALGVAMSALPKPAAGTAAMPESQKKRGAKAKSTGTNSKRSARARSASASKNTKTPPSGK